MRGFEVVTSDDRIVGHVADVRDGYLIVESGHVRKARHPVPREFVHVVDEAAKAFVTVPRRVVMDAPEVDRKGFFDRRKAARHYGLAESYIAPSAEGRGETLGHDPRLGVRARAARPSIAGRRSESSCGPGTRTSTGPPRPLCSATGTSTGAARRPTRPTASSRKPCSARRARLGLVVRATPCDLHLGAGRAMKPGTRRCTRDASAFLAPPGDARVRPSTRTPRLDRGRASRRAPRRSARCTTRRARSGVPPCGSERTPCNRASGASITTRRGTVTNAFAASLTTWTNSRGTGCLGLAHIAPLRRSDTRRARLPRARAIRSVAPVPTSNPLIPASSRSLTLRIPRTCLCRRLSPWGRRCSLSKPAARVAAERSGAHRAPRLAAEARDRVRSRRKRLSSRIRSTGWRGDSSAAARRPRT